MLKYFIAVMSLAAFVAVGCSTPPEKKESTDSTEPTTESKTDDASVSSRGMSLVLSQLNDKLSSQVNPILFGPYQTAVTQSIMKDQLEKYFDIIKEVVNTVNEKLPGYVVQVTGYGNPPKGAETEGAKNTAMKLSKARAKNLRAALVKKGLKAEVLVSKGMGDADRVTATFDPENKEEWGKNRRVILKIIKKEE